MSWCEATVQTRTEVMADFVLRVPGSSKSLECRIGIEDSYGSCSCATVELSQFTGHEGAVETRKEPTITFSLSAMQMAAGWCRETLTSMRRPGLKHGALAAV